MSMMHARTSDVALVVLMCSFFSGSPYRSGSSEIDGDLQLEDNESHICATTAQTAEGVEEQLMNGKLMNGNPLNGQEEFNTYPQNGNYGHWFDEMVSLANGNPPKEATAWSWLGRDMKWMKSGKSKLLIYRVTTWENNELRLLVYSIGPPFTKKCDDAIFTPKGAMPTLVEFELKPGPGWIYNHDYHDPLKKISTWKEGGRIRCEGSVQLSFTPRGVQINIHGESAGNDIQTLHLKPIEYFYPQTGELELAVNPRSQPWTPDDF
mmetsp:Transcript_53943/g.101303  ORF Transcript_53943/g.101303 Transcript_53943/m.101303 type:complete len:264 (+) Transcript_53943:30-821(+)